jgi:hypothetical protein
MMLESLQVPISVNAHHYLFRELREGKFSDDFSTFHRCYETERRREVEKVVLIRNAGLQMNFCGGHVHQ